MTAKPSALVKPTLDTRFHIDYDWWERTPSEDLRVYLLTHLKPEQRERLAQAPEDQQVDFIDPVTAEVKRLNAMGQALLSAATAQDFITDEDSLVDAIFRVFLRNDNTPLSSRELESATGRPARTILNLLKGRQVYKGIRPYIEQKPKSS